jgi:murein DD-endopeptidase MepM/ murein hydrolase activator NlpD
MPTETATPSAYVGKRVARSGTATPKTAAEIVLEALAPPAAPAPVETAPIGTTPVVTAPVVTAPVVTTPSFLEAMTDLDPAPATPAPATPAPRVEHRHRADVAPRVELPPLIDIPVIEPVVTLESPVEPAPIATVATLPVAEPVATTQAAPAVELAGVTPGKRRASKHTGSRGPLFRILPSAPVLAGIATMAVAIGGALTSGVSSDLISTVSGDGSSRVVQASALSGTAGESATSLIQGRSAGVSRDGQRDAEGDAATSPLEAATEAQAEQRDNALKNLAQQAQQQSDKIALNLWVLPVDGYHITNTFGMARSYYSSGYHTGLDFAAPYGTAIHSVANGVVLSASYDGAYGNKTVVQLEDGTEIWYCHQSSFAASAGDTVTAGELIGYIGETGNAYGAHLHIEVHPGGGDAVDPYPAFVQHGVTP